MNPSASPTTARAGNRSRSGGSAASAAIHSGTVATINAVRPDGTDCSAKTTPPLPPRRSSVPTIASARSSRAPTATRRPASRSANSIPAPATVNRTPASTGGGMLVSAMRIARYVDPHAM